MFSRLLTLSMLTLFLTACNISGSGQKGPFKAGSTVTVSKLDKQAQAIADKTITTQTRGKRGYYTASKIRWKGWAEITISGQYFNEYDNSNAGGSLTLSAITNKNRRFDHANVHLFSHLTAARVRALIASGKNRSQAWRRAQRDMIQQFDLKKVTQNINRGVEQLNLLQGRGRYARDNANLLLFSGSFLATGGDEPMLSTLAEDFADDGEINGGATSLFNTIAVKASMPNLLERLSQNLIDHGVRNPPNPADMPQFPSWVVEETTPADTTPPVITIVNHEVTLNLGDDFVEDVTASDDVDGDISENVIIRGEVDTQTAGTYQLFYNVNDDAGNAADEVLRTIIIEHIADTTAPVITTGSSVVNLSIGDQFVDDMRATDNVDGDITAQVTILGSVDTNQIGTYELTYNVQDSARNTATQVQRTVIVSPAPDSTPPVINVGATAVALFVGDAFNEDVSASDNIDGDITNKVIINGTVDTNTAGVYTLIYTVADLTGNAALAVTRTVTVKPLPDTVPPTIMVGATHITLTVGDVFVEDVSATDDVDGDISADVKIVGTVDINAAAEYTLVYSVSDKAGNPAETVTRTVTVNEAPDVTPPVITIGNTRVTLFVGEEFTDDMSALDNKDGDITAKVMINGNVNINTAGEYRLTYNVSDAADNAAIQVTRTVTVQQRNVGQPLAISGSIMTHNGNTIDNVLIRVYKNDVLLADTATSNAQGQYSLPLNTATDYVLVLEKAGYATQVVPVNSTNSDKLMLNIQMLAEKPPVAFDSTVRLAAVGSSGSAVVAEADSFEGSGHLIYNITPWDSAVDVAALPGSASAMFSNQANSASFSLLGASEFTFIDSVTHQEVNLAPNKQASITIPLNHLTGENGVNLVAGNTVPLLYLDESTGIWQQEGTATVIASANSPTGLAARATVSHFTWWSIGFNFSNVPSSFINISFTNRHAGATGYVKVKARTTADVVQYPELGTLNFGKTKQFSFIRKPNTKACFWLEIHEFSANGNETIKMTPQQCIQYEPNPPVYELKFINVSSSRTIYDAQSKLLWTDDFNIPPSDRTWDEAVSYCSTLSLSGHSDWELADYGHYLDAIASEILLQTKAENQSKLYWTASILPGSNQASMLNIRQGYNALGIMGLRDKSQKAGLRCVRFFPL